MNYSKDEIMQYVREEDVKFIRLSFCDVYGRPKNIAIMPDELSRAFEYGISFDALPIEGFGNEKHGTLLLHPETETLMPLPWRPEHGRVIALFSSITHPDGTPFSCDTRSLLRKAVCEAEKSGLHFTFSGEQKYYLFRTDENAEPTRIPCDNAGYMDIAPEDHGENIRREVCLTLEQMGIRPESSHHEEGPGQNEIKIRFAQAMNAADYAMTFRRVVRTVAYRNGMIADFSPMPLKDMPGNDFHINMSVSPPESESVISHMSAGILQNAAAMTAFLNPQKASFDRLNTPGAPRQIGWSRGSRSQIVRIPVSAGDRRRVELLSPDPAANPYLAFTLMIYAALEGIKKQLPLLRQPDSESDAGERSGYEPENLPSSLEEACRAADTSDFIKAHIPDEITAIYCRKSGKGVPNESEGTNL